MIFYRALIGLTWLVAFKPLRLIAIKNSFLCENISIKLIKTQLQARTASSIAMRDSGISVDDALLFFRMSDTVRPQVTQP